MKRTYNYLFYKFYRFSEAAPSKWMSEWKAGLLMDVIIAFILLSAYVYSRVFFDFGFELQRNYLTALGFIMLISVPNYFIFNYRDRWKKVVKDFDSLPRNKNRIGSLIVLLFVLMVITNLVFSIYLLAEHRSR